MINVKIQNRRGLGGVGIFLAKKWIDKVNDIRGVINGIIVIKVIFKRIIFHRSLISLFMLKMWFK